MSEEACVQKNEMSLRKILVSFPLPIAPAWFLPSFSCHTTQMALKLLETTQNMHCAVCSAYGSALAPRSLANSQTSQNLALRGKDHCRTGANLHREQPIAFRGFV